MPVARQIGAAIKWLRERCGLRQKELAAKAKITTGMISSYETGKQRPTLGTLEKILKALGADFCDLHCAEEFVHGRPAAVHDLSPQFQPGQAIPSSPAAPKPPAPDPRTARTPAGGSGGETESGPPLPPLPVELARAVKGAVSGVETILETVLRLVLAGTARPS
jgi:transcriptional regulator with XRE-family HTH domain